MATAHLIRSEDEAIETARALAASFARQADARDRDRRLPAAEVAELSESGLLGITVPARYGGAEVSVATLAEVFRLLAAADASLAQIPHSHFVFLEALRLQGTEEQRKHYFAEALAGARFANAQAERAGRTAAEDATTLRRRPGGGYVLDGEKFYSTGSLFADWLVVRAVLADAPPVAGAAPKALAYLRRDTPGVTVEDDWDGIGQRTTASGTVRLSGVHVDEDQVVPYTPIFARPTTFGARAQVLHAALDVGIARGALDAAVAAVARARPWFESGAATAAEDPLVVQQAGELEITVRGAEALVREAAAAIDAAERDLTEDTAARASIATAAAKVAAARAALEASAGLFELGGTRSAAASLNLSRYWRDARTHTLHDPARWKVQHIGRWLLSGTRPPRHGQL
ncbi:SfnB family sulfur acquisition oxidoreductase [Thermopolyspora flexuosa]|uniref:Dibenzothiophene monooxygenase n=1 Tax=Thermopolyspora flexuosa TaxID=103836 RepID=A0A543IWT6_9ACTN|nr:SfnB family sulfur acquisition oxidoreductase [Thermopolyspora flexuosa]TQM75030.1 SfnB family sulfur acquisition oxidoreductase [Thermopolyspora flexuosa]GGM92701.1 SfnB family sulfur acquisition oxidoreductase [Thermopolyspora flexuosa]